MKKNYVVNSMNSFIAFGAALIFLVLSFSGMVLSKWIPAGIFLLLGIVYLAVGLLNGSALNVSRTGIVRHIFGIRLKSMPMKEIKEIGIVGLSVFGSKKRTGARYIYFSNHKMTDKERFDMCVAWPPKDALYMAWSPQRHEEICRIWDKDFAQYNAGDLN